MNEKEDDINAVVEEFFSLWQQQCSTHLHTAETVSGMLGLLEKNLDIPAGFQQEKEGEASKNGAHNDIFDDATTSIFRYMVAQLPKRGAGNAKEPNKCTDME